MVGEYKLWKQTAFFFNLRNVGDATEDVKIFGPSTPEVARFRTRIDYASSGRLGSRARSDRRDGDHRSRIAQVSEAA